jgi:hypothetical protein
MDFPVRPVVGRQGRRSIPQRQTIMGNILAGLLFGCGVPLLLIFIGVTAARWVLGPLDRAAKNHQHPRQFTLADFLCLFVQIQLTLAGPALAFRQMEDKATVAKIAAVIIGLVLLVWWTGVRTLSRAGVHDTLGRALTLTVAIPFGYAFSIAVSILPIGVVASLADGPRPNLALAGILFLAELAIILLVIALGYMTRRILATAQRQGETTPPEQQPPPV